MHDVLDLRNLVVDEAEQLTLCGVEIGDLALRAQAAATAHDLPLLERLYVELEAIASVPAGDAASADKLAALAESAPRFSVDRRELPDRIAGAWTGRAIANTIGKPIEGLTRTEVGVYLRAAEQWPLRGYLPLVEPLPEGVGVLHPSAPVATAGRFEMSPRDDDVDWTILALHVMEKHGRSFTTEDLAREWLDRVPFTQTYTAERAAYRNLIRGLTPPSTATYRNPYREWIGALIRGDAFGYVNPGDPGEAARRALVDARLSHTENGVYGELWAAALCASALAGLPVSDVLASARAVIPETSRLAVALRSVEQLHRGGVSWEEALDWIDRELGEYPWVHTVNNAAQIAIGLLWGTSFLDAIHITIAGGRDTDSNAATVGSVWGALHGMGSLPPELVDPTHRRVRSAIRDFDRSSIDDLVRRTLALID